MTYYRTNKTLFRIEPVEVEKATEHFVTIKGTRFSKITSYDCYFPTREDAKQYVIDCYLGDIADLEERLKSARERLKRAEAL